MIRTTGARMRMASSALALVCAGHIVSCGPESPNDGGAGAGGTESSGGSAEESGGTTSDSGGASSGGAPASGGASGGSTGGSGGGTGGTLPDPTLYVSTAADLADESAYDYAD